MAGAQPAAHSRCERLVGATPRASELANLISALHHWQHMARTYSTATTIEMTDNNKVCFHLTPTSFSPQDPGTRSFPTTLELFLVSAGPLGHFPLLRAGRGPTLNGLTDHGKLDALPAQVFCQLSLIPLSLNSSSQDRNGHRHHVTSGRIEACIEALWNLRRTFFGGSWSPPERRFWTLGLELGQRPSRG